MVRGNTKIGPVSYHQGRYGIEIRIKSLFDDGSHSWILIVNGLNTHVTEMSEETQENRNDEIGDSAGRPAAEVRLKETSMPMDRRRTRRVRPKFFWSFEENDQIASTWSFCTTRRRRSSWSQNFGTGVCLKIRVFSAWSIRTSESFAKRGWSQEEMPVLSGSLLCWYQEKNVEQFKATLEENKLIQHCRTRCCYRATSPSTSTTLEAPTTCTPSSNQDWFRVEKKKRNGDRRYSSQPWVLCPYIYTSRGITTWRSPELQCTSKIGKYTRTQHTGPTWGLLRRMDWRSIKQDLTRSSFTTPHQRCVLRRWWSWIQEKIFSTKSMDLLVHRKELYWNRPCTMDARILHALKRASNAHSGECRETSSGEIDYRINSRATIFCSSTRKWHTQGSSQKVDSSIRNASKSRGVESRPEAKLRVQPIQRKVAGRDPQHGKRGVLGCCARLRTFSFSLGWLISDYVMYSPVWAN